MSKLKQTPKNQKLIRIGFVMHVMQVAGAEVLVKQMIEQLSDKIEATVFCLDAEGELGRQLSVRGHSVVVLNRKPGLDWKVAKRLASEVHSRDIQLLHAHQYTPFFYSAMSRLLHGNECKIIFTEHGRHYPDVVSIKRRLANKWLLQRYADLTTACCDFSAEALRSNEGFSQAFTLRNGVDLSTLKTRGTQREVADLRQQLGLSTDKQYAACIARFHPVKDHRTLIHAWKAVSASVPDAELLLIGDGECRSECESLAKELSVADSIQFWGIRHDVPEILRAIDVFTLTSVSEAASLTLLEAMASGCPAVLTDVGGNAEHVNHGEEGFLAPRGDSQMLAKYLIEILANPPLGSSMGLKARSRVEKDFNLANVISEYASLFTQLTADSKSCESS